MKNLLLFTLFSFSSAIITACGAGKPENSSTEMGGINAGPDSECGRVLDGDLFNKINDNGSTIERDLAQMRFFMQNEQEAWNTYKQAKSSSGGGNGNANVNVIGIVDVNLGGGGNSAQSFEEFRQAFQSAKGVFQQQMNTDRYRNANHTYSTIIRDPESIHGWRDCMLAQTGAPKFSMALRRQSSNVVVAQVYYSGGFFGGEIPKLNIGFTGGTVLGSQTMTVGQGTKLFSIQINPGTMGLGVNGETASGNSNFSYYEDSLPPTKEEFDNIRCHLQNVIMLSARKIPASLYSGLEANGWVASPGGGSMSCEQWKR